MRRFSWLLYLIVFLGLPGFGIHILYVAIKSPHPTVMSCADYLRNPGDQLWLDLHDCRIDYGRSIRLYNKDRGEQSGDDNYAPVVAGSDNGPVVLFIKLDDKSNEMLNALPDHPTREQVVAFAQQIDAGKLREIKGTVQTGPDSDEKVRTAISTAGVPVVEDWKIIEQHDPTSWTVGVLLLLIPLGVGTWLFLRWRGQDHVPDTGRPPGPDMRQ